MGRRPKPRVLSRGDEQNTTERVYEQLKRKIHDNKLVPGKAYLQPEIARLLGVSRTPAREAIIRLQAEHLVEIQPRRGFLIRATTGREVREISEALSVLEAFAVHRIASIGADPGLLRRLERCHANMIAALEKNDIHAWIREDEQFHQELIKAAQQTEIARIVGALWDRFKRFRRQTIHIRQNLVCSNREHASVISAIRRRQADRAFDLQRKHHMRIASTIEAVLLKHGIEQV